MSGNDELINQERGALERLTVNLTPKAQKALRRAAKHYGDTLTDTVNRAIQYYDFALQYHREKREPCRGDCKLTFPDHHLCQRHHLCGPCHDRHLLP